MSGMVESVGLVDAEGANQGDIGGARVRYAPGDGFCAAGDGLCIGEHGDIFTESGAGRQFRDCKFVGLLHATFWSARR